MITFISLLALAPHPLVQVARPNAPQAPTGLEYSVPVKFHGTLTYPDGQPWLLGGLAEIRVRSRGFKSDHGFTTNALGEYDFLVEIPQSYIDESAPISTTFWALDSVKERFETHRFFLDPENGRAAFAPSVTPTLDNNGDLEIVGSHALSLPPSYGDLVVANPSGQNISLGVVDFAEGTSSIGPTPEQLAIRTALLCPLTPMSVSGGTLHIYRWSRSPGSHVFVFGPNQCPVGAAVLRRTATLPLTVAKAETLSIDIDESAYPSAYAIMVIQPGFHSPNPALMTNSDRSFYIQHGDATATSSVGFVNGGFSRGYTLPDSDYVVELWATHVVNGHTQMYLAASSAVLSATNSPSVHFN